MARSSIKMRTKVKDGLIEVKALISHPMETGRRKIKGELVPAHYIKEVLVTANEKPILRADWAGLISKNPYISFKYKGAVGDKVKLTWVDNKEETDFLEVEVKEKKKR